MPRALLVLILPMAAALAHAAGAGAQAEPAPGPRIAVSVTVGSVGYGSLHLQPVLAERVPDEEGGEGADGPALLRRTVNMDSGLQAAGSVTLAMNPWWSLRAGVAVGRARLTQAFAGTDTWVADAAAVPVIGNADVSLSTMEAVIRYRLPAARSLRPYLEVGAAAERWQSRGDGAAPYPGAGALADAVTRVGGHAAVGALYPLTDRWAARAQASMRAFQTPLGPVQAGVELGRTDEVVLTFQDAVTGAFADPPMELIQGLRLELGISYGLAGAVAPRTDPPGSDASPPAPPR